MGTIIYVILGCLLVGIILSAPMGPIGVLVIQRTMEKGRKSGLYTGVGAAVSDLLYCLLVGFGLAFITDFIKKYKALFQIGGGVMLILFALFMILHTPTSHNLHHQDAKKISFTHDALTGFVLTFLNPLIIFFIFTLFTLIVFPSADYKFYHIILGYLFIVAGALLWWFGITYLVDKLRSRFNIRTVSIINKVLGGIIMLVAVVYIVIGLKDYFHL